MFLWAPDGHSVTPSPAASLAKEAEEQFETVKLELMTKRAEAQAKTDGW